MTTARADTPGFDRPGLGFSPSVLAAGQFALEQGLPDGSHDAADGVRTTQYTADGLLRLGLGDALELQLGGTPYSRQRVAGNGGHDAGHGHGDSTVGLKYAPSPTGGTFGWGLLGNIEANDGGRDFRADRRQYLLGLQLNWQTGSANTLGAYLENVRAGGRDRRTLALNDTFNPRPDLAPYVEAALVHVPQRGAGSLAGAGLAWMATPRVQLDAGFDRRLSGAATRWQANLGVSIYFGR